MSSFSNFNDIYGRMEILNEARASVKKDFPSLGSTWKKASMAARESGASAPTREAKNTVLGVIAALLEIKLGREISVEEESELMRFRNIPSQAPLIEYLTTQEINGQTIGSIISSASEEEIQAANDATGLGDSGAKFQMGQRAADRQEQYKQRALDREEAKKAKEAAKIADAEGEPELADTLDDIGRGLVGFAKGIADADLGVLDFDDIDIRVDDSLENKDEIVDKLIATLNGGDFTAERSGVGVNVEGPAGGFGDEDKARDLVFKVVNHFFPDVHEDLIEVDLNTSAAIEDAESPVGHSDENIERYFDEFDDSGFKEGDEVLVEVQPGDTRWGSVEEVDNAGAWVIDQEGGSLGYYNFKDLDRYDGGGQPVANNNKVPRSVIDAAAKKLGGKPKGVVSETYYSRGFDYSPGYPGQDDRIFGQEIIDSGEELEKLDDEELMKVAEQRGLQDQLKVRRTSFGTYLDNREEVIQMIKARGSEDEEGVDIWSLSPEQVSKLAEHMGQDESIQDITALIEYMAHDAGPKEVEDMLESEAKFLFGKNEEETVTESYTAGYMTEQSSKDARNKKPVTESVSFKDRYKPKTSWQLEELRRYGL